MANKFFPLGAEKVLGKQIDWENDDLRAIPVSSAYTFDSADEFLSDLSGVTLGTAVALTGKTIAGGVFDADDVSFTVPSSTSKAVVIYLHTGVDSTSPLLLYIDSINGFPFTTAGGAVPIQWSNGTGKIMTLAA